MEDENEQGYSTLQERVVGKSSLIEDQERKDIGEL